MWILYPSIALDYYLKFSIPAIHVPGHLLNIWLFCFFCCFGFLLLLLLEWYQTLQKSFGWNYKLRSIAGIRTQKDHIHTLKPVVHVNVRWIMETLKYPSMHWKRQSSECWGWTLYGRRWRGYQSRYTSTSIGLGCYSVWSSRSPLSEHQNRGRKVSGHTCWSRAGAAGVLFNYLHWLCSVPIPPLCYCTSM